MDLVRRFRPLMWVLLLLNVVVLLGQVWPEGAPPLARAVNIAFLALSLVVFVARVREERGGDDTMVRKCRCASGCESAAPAGGGVDRRLPVLRAND